MTAARENGTREPLVIARLWGSGRAVRTDADVTIASIQKLHAIYRQDDHDVSRGELQALGERLGVIVVDEAHRALAPTYGAVLRFFGVEVAGGRGSPVPVLGLTATPGRGVDEETRRLVTRFHGRLRRRRCSAMSR